MNWEVGRVDAPQGTGARSPGPEDHPAARDDSSSNEARPSKPREHGAKFRILLKDLRFPAFD